MNINVLEEIIKINLQKYSHLPTELHETKKEYYKVGKTKGVSQRSGDYTALYPRDMRSNQKPAFLQNAHLEETGILKPPH